MVIEARHNDLGLKDLGSNESSDDLTTISWLICGKEFVLLEHNGDPWTIYDAVEVPTPSADDVFIGPCELKGKEMKDSVVAVLSWPLGSNPLKLRQPENHILVLFLRCRVRPHPVIPTDQGRAARIRRLAPRRIDDGPPILNPKNAGSSEASARDGKTSIK